jgi:hypothetical protein
MHLTKERLSLFRCQFTPLRLGSLQPSNWFSRGRLRLDAVALDRHEPGGDPGVGGAAESLGRTDCECAHSPRRNFAAPSQYERMKHPPDKEYGDDGPAMRTIQSPGVFGFPKLNMRHGSRA